MTTRALSLLCAPLVLLVACDLEPGINAPDPDQPPIEVEDVRSMTTSCQDGWEYKSPTLGPGVAYDPDFIQMSCGPHADYFGDDWCSSFKATVTLEVKNGPDHAIFSCDGSTRTLRSDGLTPEGITIIPPDQHSCWNCLGVCAAAGECPDEADDCRVVPGNSSGSDCRPVYCGEGWEVVDQFPYTPRCRRPCGSEPITVSIDGPSQIQPDATCTWSADASGGNGSLTFNWYNENHWAGSGSHYTGGRPDGTIYPTFRLRLVASDGQQSESTEITVQEDPNAMICMM